MQQRAPSSSTGSHATGSRRTPFARAWGPGARSHRRRASAGASRRSCTPPRDGGERRAVRQLVDYTLRLGSVAFTHGFAPCRRPAPSCNRQVPPDPWSKKLTSYGSKVRMPYSPCDGFRGQEGSADDGRRMSTPVPDPNSAPHDRPVYRAEGLVPIFLSSDTSRVVKSLLPPENNRIL